MHVKKKKKKLAPSNYLNPFILKIYIYKYLQLKKISKGMIFSTYIAPIKIF